MQTLWYESSWTDPRVRSVSEQSENSWKLVRDTLNSLFATTSDFHLAAKSHELKSGRKVGRRRYPKGPIGIDGADG